MLQPHTHELLKYLGNDAILRIRLAAALRHLHMVRIDTLNRLQRLWQVKLRGEIAYYLYSEVPSQSMFSTSGHLL